LRSTVLGGRVISEYLGYSGQAEWNGTYVYAGGQRIGTLSKTGGGAARNFWQAADPLTGDEVTTMDNGVLSTQTTFDAQGIDVGASDPFPPPGQGDGECIEYDPNYVGPQRFAANLIPEGNSATCVIDHIEQNCGSVGSEAAAQCPDNDCGPRFNANRDGSGRGGWEFLYLTAAGFSYQPLGPSTRPPGMKAPILAQRGSNSNSSNPVGDDWLDDEGYDQLSDSLIPVRYDLPQNPTPNRNCIANAVAGGRVGDTRNIIPGAYGGNAHDGIHVEAGPGIHPVTALPAMAGRVLHAGPQDVVGTIGHNFSVVDIVLNPRIDGQRYVMTLKDMGYDTGIRSGRVVPGRTIGSVEGSANPVGETGLHVTLMPLSVYNQYINGRFTGSSRSSVPVNQLMDAARDPRSPFRCP